MWSDGVRYCTPASQPAVFVDDACTQLVGKASPGTTPAYFHREYVLRGERLPSRLHAARDRVAAPLLVWELLDGQCLGPLDADPSSDYFALGPALASDAFVHVAQTERSSDTRLVHATYTSEDGMQLPIARALRDSLLDVACTPTALAHADVATCVPAMPTAEYFRDDGCAEPALAVRSGAALPTFVAYADGSACPAYAYAGDAIALPAPFRRTAAGCVSAIASSDDRFFAIGAPLDLATLSRTRTLAPGHRLARIQLRDGAHVVEDARLHDTLLDIECERVPTPEGDRCLPRSGLVAEREPMFSDESCTTPLALVLVPAARCEVPTHVVDRTDGLSVHAVSRYTGAIFHLSTGDRCLPYTVAGTAQPYALGTALPLTMFVGSMPVVD